MQRGQLKKSKQFQQESKQNRSSIWGKISYAITYPGASMQSSDLVHPI